MTSSAPRRIAVVGGGILGLTTGLRLAQAGHRPVVFEAAPAFGGLAAADPIGGYVWDRFYHVILQADARLLGLLEEIGVADRLRWRKASTHFYIDDRFVPLTTSLDFLRFPPISLLDKVRLALTILYAARIRDWRRLEEVDAVTWLTRLSGRRVVERLWRPLLEAKLGENYTRVSAAFIWAIIARMYGARRTGAKQELFGHVEGGYDVILAALVRAARDAGVELRTGAPVASVQDLGPGGGVRILAREGEGEPFDAAILTLPSCYVPDVCPGLSEPEKARHRSVVYQGMICASVLLERPLIGSYITNLAAAGLPFTAVIEMTALVDRARFGGRSLVYLPRYVSQEDAYWDLADDEIRDRFLAALRRMYPDLGEADVAAFQVARARPVLALSTLNYSRDHMPDWRTSLPGVFVANSAQIPNGTLNVNETLGVIDRMLPGFLDLMDGSDRP